MKHEYIYLPLNQELQKHLWDVLDEEADYDLENLLDTTSNFSDALKRLEKTARLQRVLWKCMHPGNSESLGRRLKELYPEKDEEYIDNFIKWRKRVLNGFDDDKAPITGPLHSIRDGKENGEADQAVKDNVLNNLKLLWEMVEKGEVEDMDALLYDLRALTNTG